MGLPLIEHAVGYLWGGRSRSSSRSSLTIGIVHDPNSRKDPYSRW